MASECESIQSDTALDGMKHISALDRRLFQRGLEASGIVQQRMLSQVISEPFKGGMETEKDIFSKCPEKANELI